MKCRWLVLMACGGLLLGAAPRAAAQVTIGAEVFGSMSTYAMDDWNDVIQELNAEARMALGRDFMDEISNGFGGGLGVRVWVSPNVMLSAAWEPLFAGSESSIFVPGAGEASVEFGLNANSFQFTGAYFVPATPSQKYGIGAGLGFYSLKDELKLVVPGESIRGDVEGSAVGFHLLGLGEWTVSPGFAIHAGAGYRYAKIADTKLDGESSVPEFETDYSGFTGRVGLAFYLPTR